MCCRSRPSASRPPPRPQRSRRRRWCRWAPRSTARSCSAPRAPPRSSPTTLLPIVPFPHPLSLPRGHRQGPLRSTPLCPSDLLPRPITDLLLISLTPLRLSLAVLYITPRRARASRRPPSARRSRPTWAGTSSPSTPPVATCRHRRPWPHLSIPLSPHVIHSPLRTHGCVDFLANGLQNVAARMSYIFDKLKVRLVGAAVVCAAATVHRSSSYPHNHIHAFHINVPALPYPRPL